jgi:di/tricarboxylate transporter
MVGMFIFILVMLVRNKPSDAVLLGAVVLCTVFGIVTPKEALSGFSNTGMLTVAALFAVAAAMRETGALDTFGHWMLGQVRKERGALIRMAVFVPPVSAFLNNTPIVAMLIPVLTEWCRKNSISPSRLLMPLSFLAILGGTCTLIGTSTNLVVNGMLSDAAAEHALLAATANVQDAAMHEAMEESLRPMGLFELSYVGLPYIVVGILYLLFVGNRLLPKRTDFLTRLDETAREYLIELRIETGCNLIGKEVEEAGLRRLPGLFLIEIARNGDVMSPASPRHVLNDGDILTFTGVVDSIVDLERIPGLVPVADEGYIAQAAARRHQTMCEAVISGTSPLVNKTIREANFRAAYNAAVVAVSRGGQRLKGRVGDIRLENGDTLLLQTGAHFLQAHRNNADFILVSGLAEARPVRHDKALISILLLIALVMLMATGILGGPIVPAFLIAGVMVATRCISASQVRQSMDWQTLITIAAALGLGNAVKNSGLVDICGVAVASALTGLGEAGPYALIAATYTITGAATATITNKASAALMFPFALAMSQELGVDPRPIIMAVTFAASASFATPICYQTNLMVYGPGGYRFSDFVRVGLPLSLILLVVTTIIIPIAWPF